MVRYVSVSIVQDFLDSAEAAFGPTTGISEELFTTIKGKCDTLRQLLKDGGQEWSDDFARCGNYRAQRVRRDEVTFRSFFSTNSTFTGGAHMSTCVSFGRRYRHCLPRNGDATGEHYCSDVEATIRALAAGTSQWLEAKVARFF